jgi:hypothetical protein
MERQEGADRCTTGNSEIKVIPRAEMAELNRTGKLDPRIADTAVAAE